MNKIEDFKFKFGVNVHWGDMDAFQHVNNVTYVSWSESTRIEYFRASGFNADELRKEEGYSVILGYQDIKYFTQVVYPDKMTVTCTVSEFKKDRFNMQCHFFSKQLDRKVAISNHLLYCFDYKTNQKIDVPQSFIDLIEKFEGREITRT